MFKTLETAVAVVELSLQSADPALAQYATTLVLLLTREIACQSALISVGIFGPHATLRHSH
uniref:Uncharacterized protein n=1 Tax=Arundo donax TaxID=35708 RepID=A0A0A9AXM9_ARUDO